MLALPALPDLLDLAMNQPRQYGAADPDVANRLLELLDELTYCDRKGQYRAELMDHLDRLRNAIDAAEHSAPERKNLLDKAESISSRQV